MQKRMNSRVPAVTAGLFAVVFALDPGTLLAASDCLDQPNRTASQGGHWHYHVDRVSGRKCWRLDGPESAATAPQAEIAPPQPAPQPVRPFSSFFSSLTSGFSTTSVGAPQPDSNRDARGMVIAQPEAPKRDDAGPNRRQRADAKPDRQASSRSAKPAADQPHPASRDQAERDALFQQYLRWKERQ